VWKKSLWCLYFTLDTPQHSAYASQQFGWIVGTGQVIVSTRLKGGQLAGLVVPVAQHDHSYIALAAEAAQELAAIYLLSATGAPSRGHEVKEHQRWRLTPGKVQRGRAILGSDNAETSHLQVVSQEGNSVLPAIYYQYRRLSDVFSCFAHWSLAL
jgi:hypothetical protein